MQNAKSTRKPKGTKVIKRHVEKYKEALRIFHKRQISISAIAREIRVNPRTVCNWLRIERKPDNLPCHPYNIKKYHQALKLKRKGYFKSEIARMLRICPKTVYLWLKKAASRFNKYSENLKINQIAVEATIKKAKGVIRSHAK